MRRKLAVFPTFGKVLKSTFSELYNSLGYSMLTSTIWITAAFPILFMIFADLAFMMNSVAQKQTGAPLIPMLVFSLMLISLWYGLFFGPVLSTLYAVHQERKESYISFKSYLQYFKKYYWISARIYWAFSFGVTLILANFFISLGQNGLIFKVGGILSLYLLFFAANLPLYFQPLIFYNHKFTGIFSKAFLLVIDNFALTFLLSVFVGIILLICVPTVILLILIFGAFYLFMVDNAFELISEKYETEQNK
jgi:uncharacterized membrane protein YesL